MKPTSRSPRDRGGWRNDLKQFLRPRPGRRRKDLEWPNLSPPPRRGRLRPTTTLRSSERKSSTRIKHLHSSNRLPSLSVLPPVPSPRLTQHSIASSHRLLPHRLEVDLLIFSLCSLQGGTLKDYQLRGVKWLLTLYQHGVNGILADEMGLGPSYRNLPRHFVDFFLSRSGKTLQTIAFIASLRENQVPGPILVVCPLSVVDTWKAEIER